MDKTDRNDLAMHSRGSCDLCKYCGLTAAANKVVGFICRKNPPTVSAALVMSPQGPQWSGCSNWPAVTKNDWCGSYEPMLH